MLRSLSSIFCRRCVISIAAVSCSLGVARADPVAEARWENRLLAVAVTDEAAANRVATEAQLLAEKLADRDLRLVFLDGQSTLQVPSLQLTEAERETYRKRWNVEAGATQFLLIGKDGGLKQRQKGALDWEEIFDAIDAMPMRRAEMRARQNGEESASRGE